MNFQTLELSHDSGVATVTLNRPEKRNALSVRLLNELVSALDEIEKSEAEVLILTGAGKAFCAGMDLDELKTLTGKSHDENVEDSRRMAQIFRRLYDFPKPTIAAVNGAAIAGGTGLATMCDFTLAAPEAKFGNRGPPLGTGQRSRSCGATDGAGPRTGESTDGKQSSVFADDEKAHQQLHCRRTGSAN